MISLSKIKLIVYDFDGVMTDNRVIVLQDGTEGVIANRADGLGVSYFRSMGIPQLILSTESNPVVKARASKLKLEVISSSDDKKRDLTDYCRKNRYNLYNVLYVGNDINDLDVMKSVGFPVAPADAHKSVKAVAVHITQSKGGEGVIKELSESLNVN